MTDNEQLQSYMSALEFSPEDLYLNREGVVASEQLQRIVARQRFELASRQAFNRIVRRKALLIVVTVIASQLARSEELWVLISMGFCLGSVWLFFVPMFMILYKEDNLEHNLRRSMDDPQPTEGIVAHDKGKLQVGNQTFALSSIQLQAFKPGTQVVLYTIARPHTLLSAEPVATARRYWDEIARQKTELRRIRKKYRPLVPNNLYGMYLTPDIALQLVDDLESAHIPNYGCTTYQLHVGEEGSYGVMEVYWHEIAIPDDIMHTDDAVQKTAAYLREGLQNLSSEVDLVEVDVFPKSLIDLWHKGDDADNGPEVHWFAPCWRSASLQPFQSVLLHP